METNSKGSYDYMNYSGLFPSNILNDIKLIRTGANPETSYTSFNIPMNYQSRDHNAINEHSQQSNQCFPREMINPSTMCYQSQESNLEKLFSHATEVKGDLESVINTLVEIIGNGENSTSNEQHDHDLSQNNHVDLDSTAYTNSRPYTSIYGAPSSNSLSNKEKFSVNVESVLKKVRANKRNNEKYKIRYDSSQSSESSREKATDNREQQLNTCAYNTRSMLSDPGQSERRNQSMEMNMNRRKHKYKNYNNNNNNNSHNNNNTITNWIPTDVCIKRSKSLKSGNEMNTEFTPVQIGNTVLQNSNDTSKVCNQWVGLEKHSSNLDHFDSREIYNLPKQDIQMSAIDASNSNLYNQQPNYCWNLEREVSNVLDESSCSSWSVVSHNQSNLTHGQNIIQNRHQYNIGKETPSISVSDSEGSIELPRPIPVKRIPRLPSLGTQLKSKEGQFELILINQPEQHHRARYMTEGSRGAVKDKTGNSFPTIQLIGWKRPATLQVFVGTEDGRVKPHSFYQACKVSGKQIILCKERIFDGIGLIEIQIEAKDNQILVLDCIGILKLRNVDVERRSGIQRVKLKSTMARLIFRVNLPHGDGFFTCLQVTSDPILCTQPVGSPEICKMSLYEGSCKGNMELFIIGKNIVKCCQVLFQDYSEYKGVIWQAEARIDVEYLHQSHLVCTVPPYCNENLKTPVTVQVVINCSGRLSEPRYFTYLSDTSTKPYNIIDSYEMEEWKMLKTEFTDNPSFSMGNHHLNNDLLILDQDEACLKSSSKVMYDPEYEKLEEQSYNHSSNHESAYKALDNLPLRNVMEWMPCISTHDISISVMNTSSSLDNMANSLESNIQNDSILHFSPFDHNQATVVHSESQKTLTN